MKAKKLTLMTLALATVSLAACNDNNQQPNSNGGTPTSSASNVYVDFISADANKTLPLFKVNETIDLAEYYNVEYSDGSTDKNFTVSVYEKDQASVLIEGTKVTVKKTGVYDLTLKAGQFESMITIDCRSEKGIEVINFFKKLQANPTNYTVDMLDISNRPSSPMAKAIGATSRPTAMSNSSQATSVPTGATTTSTCHSASTAPYSPAPSISSAMKPSPPARPSLKPFIRSLFRWVLTTATNSARPKSLN